MVASGEAEETKEVPESIRTVRSVRGVMIIFRLFDDALNKMEEPDFDEALERLAKMNALTMFPTSLSQYLTLHNFKLSCS